jgi:MFS family permease
MSKHHEASSIGNGRGIPPSVPLQRINDRHSLDSTDTTDFERLLNDDVSDTSSTDGSLPPIDRGRGAWMCLLGCWLVEAMIWGFAISFGVFQRYYAAHPLFRESVSIATIGTLATGVSYLGMPFTNAIAIQWPRYRRRMCFAGWSLCVGSLAAASLATGVAQLLVYQGLLFGVGWVVCYTPFLFILNEWWVERRGFAYGVLFAASGVSGLFIPVLLDFMLERYGFRTALRTYMMLIVAISGPGLFLIQHRQPPSQHQKHVEKTTTSAIQALKPFVTNFHFLILATAVFLQGLGFFIPNIFIPDFAKVMGISSQASSGILALISLSQIAGQLWQGWMSDRVNVYIPAAVSAFYCAVGAFFLWGWAKGIGWLIPFAMIWGFFSASYSVLYTRMVSFLLNGDRLDLPTDERVGMILYGFFSFERGVSNILEGPISGWLSAAAGKRVYWDKFGLGRYEYIVVFTIVCMGLSSLVGVGWRRRYIDHPSIYVHR